MMKKKGKHSIILNREDFFKRRAEYTAENNQEFYNRYKWQYTRNYRKTYNFHIRIIYRG